LINKTIYEKNRV